MKPRDISDFKYLRFHQRGYKFIQKKVGGEVFLDIFKIGQIPVEVDQDIEGQIKKVVVEKNESGEWYVSLTTGLYFPITAKRRTS